MTAYLAAAGRNAVFLAADTKRSDVVTGTQTGTIGKIQTLPGPVLWAKGGYGSDADSLFDQVRLSIGSRRTNLDEVEKLTFDKGGPVYEACRAKAAGLGVEDLGLYVIMLGFNSAKQGVMRSIIFRTGERKIFGVGSFVVLASDTPKAQSLINGMETSFLVPGTAKLQSDAWGFSCLERIALHLPLSVGLPIDLAVAHADGTTASKRAATLREVRLGPDFLIDME